MALVKLSDMSYVNPETGSRFYVQQGDNASSAFAVLCVTPGAVHPHYVDTNYADREEAQAALDEFANAVDDVVTISPPAAETATDDDEEEVTV